MCASEKYWATKLPVKSPVPTVCKLSPREWLKNLSPYENAFLKRAICGEMFLALPRSLKENTSNFYPAEVGERIQVESILEECTHTFFNKLPDDISKQFLELNEVSEGNAVLKLIHSREFQDLSSKIDSPIVKGADRNAEFEKHFLPYLKLCTNVVIHDPYAAIGLCNEESAISWLLNDYLIPSKVKVVIHTKFDAEFWKQHKNESYRVLENLVNQNIDPSPNLQIKIYEHRGKIDQNNEFPHDRFWSFHMDKGAVRFNLGQGLDLFDVYPSSSVRQAGKLKAKSGFYGATKEDIAALYSEDFKRLLKKSGVFKYNRGQNQGFSFTNSREA